VELIDGRAIVGGTDVSISLPEVAEAALRAHRLPAGVEPGLEATLTYEPPGLSFSYATHACRVAIDRETGAIAVERFAVVHDCGTVVNPMIVEGQIHGGVVQGLGEALLEEVVYDEHAQPTSMSFLDYQLPLAESVPSMDVEHTVHPSPFVPGGMKGMGEGGTIGAPAAVLNAIGDALPEIADRIVETPITPVKISALLRERVSS
jgi:carbon-monoxide dehydrogenase large subunit